MTTVTNAEKERVFRQMYHEQKLLAEALDKRWHAACEARNANSIHSLGEELSIRLGIMKDCAVGLWRLLGHDPSIVPPSGNLLEFYGHAFAEIKRTDKLAVATSN